MTNSFSYNYVPVIAVISVINNIDSSQAYQKENIPPSSILKANVDISANTTQRYKFEYKL